MAGIANDDRKRQSKNNRRSFDAILKANREARQPGLTKAQTTDAHRASPSLYFKEEPMKISQYQY